MGNSRDPEYDVVVVGSGPAGISTAIHLTQLLPSIRNRLIVLEKEVHPRKKICGGGITVYADYWLQRLGIKMLIASLTLKKTHFVLDYEGYVDYCFDAGGFRTVIREEFDDALAREAMNLGISVVQGEPVTSFSYRGEAVVVQTAKRSLISRILVGADGVQSIIRRTLYRNAGQCGPRNTCMTLRYMTPVDGFNSAERRELEAVIDFACTLRHGILGYAWSFPVTSQGQAWLNTGVGDFSTSEKEGPLSRKILAEFLTTQGISLNESQVEGSLLRWFHPESIFSTNRVLLVGDAAGIDPLWGEGISFSLGYGHAAANAIVRALKRDEFSFTTYKDQLLEHEVGRELMNRLQCANKLYHRQKTDNARDLLMSLLVRRQD
jgi:flavin-dependent dehydrogenase